MNDLVDDERDGEILKHRLVGVSIRAIARRFRVPISEVNAALARAMPAIDSPTRVNEIKLELARLDVALKPVFARVIEGDLAAISVMIRLSERRSELLGLNSPLRIDAVMVETYDNPSSVDEMEAALARLVGKPAQTH